MSRMLFQRRLAVAPNSFVDPDIGAQATQDALLKNLYSARLYGWKVRAPLKGPDDPALYQIVKEWKKTSRLVGSGGERNGVLDLTTLTDMKNAGLSSRPVPVEIDLSTYSREGVLTSQQLSPDDREFLRYFSERSREVSNFRDTVASLRAQEEQNERKQSKQYLMWGAAALGVVGLVFFLRRRK